MLDFILSKLNLLILVTALFAIVSFFYFTMVDVMLSNTANLMVSEFSREVETVLSSPTYCDHVFMKLRPRISLAGKENVFYRLNIFYNEGFLTFAIIEKADSQNILAAQAVQSNADFYLFKEDPGTGKMVSVIDLKEGIFLDPEAYPPTDSFMIIKRKKGSKDEVYLIPCKNIDYAIDAAGGASAKTCESEYSGVADMLEIPVGELICS